MEHLFEGLTPEHYMMFKGEYYRKNKDRIDQAARDQGVLDQLEKVSGGKRQKVPAV
jgi:ABC-type multidrug transport system ATPase subunit